MRDIELSAINAKLLKDSLEVKSVISDGNCLYRYRIEHVRWSQPIPNLIIKIIYSIERLRINWHLLAQMGKFTIIIHFVDWPLDILGTTLTNSVHFWVWRRPTESSPCTVTEWLLRSKPSGAVSWSWRRYPVHCNGPSWSTQKIPLLSAWTTTPVTQLCRYVWHTINTISHLGSITIQFSNYRQQLELAIST